MLKRITGRRDERGQILLMAAAGMFVFVALVGLVIDTGVGYRERRNMQNAADLSAMAGTKVIADHYLDGGRTGSDVYDAIEASLEANGCVAADGCSFTAVYVRPDTAVVGNEIDLGAVDPATGIPANTQGVRVTTETDTDTFFMRAVGIPHLHVETPATAMTSSLLNEVPGGVLLPIAAFDSDYEPGVEYELTAGEEGPGNFGWLDWDGGSPNAPELANSICNPDNPAMTFAVWIDGSTGMMNSSDVRSCLTGWLGTTVLIPIWGQTNDRGGNNLTYEIITLAAFTLTDFDQHANKVNGYFVEFYALPSVPAGYGRPPCLPTDPTCNSRTNFIGLTR
ncbi:MAG TPA: pilus assembly protein TadG-related protein [Candidatus Limnocylindria bacterium]|nr:pilus assembly protein TadG-related protein [Candidatus Limnocylindria bacterium]